MSATAFVQPVNLKALLPTAQFVGDGDILVTHATERSDLVRSGDLFAAIPGTRRNGHEFAHDAVQRGAAALLLDKAIPDFTEAIRLDPKDAAAYYERGLAERGLGRNEPAVKDYTMALGLNPKNAKIYSNRANAYSILGQYDRALQDYAAALKIDPRNARIYANRGFVLLSQGKSAEADKDFKKSLEIDPSLKKKLDSEIAARKSTAPNGK